MTYFASDGYVLDLEMPDQKPDYTTAEYYAMCETDEQRADFNEEERLDRAYARYHLREMDKYGSIIEYIDYMEKGEPNETDD